MYRFIQRAVIFQGCNWSSVSSRRLVHVGEHFTLAPLDELKLSTSVPLAGRNFLVGSQNPRFPEYLAGPKNNYPFYVRANNAKQSSLTSWGARSQEIIDQAYERYENNGDAVAILFRDMPIKDPDDFAEWLNSLKFKKIPFQETNGLTPAIREFVRTGSYEDCKFNIEPHNEQTYLPAYPEIFIMCMFKTASSGGETAFVDNREIVRRLDPSFVEKCDRKQLRYWTYFPDANGSHVSRRYKNWQQQYGTEDKSKVEAELKDSAYNFEWLHGNDLSMWHNKSPFIHHTKTNERLWFNQIAASHSSYFQAAPLFENCTQIPNKEYPFHVTYGDGEEIEIDIVDEIRRLKWENAIGFKWQDGDVLFMDNLIMQHSRLSFEGEREIGISLLNH